ncbi:MAG: hypothetical protein F6J87_00430 [Spirulina sp. SIO3F2]|nr:hypothetical protein [Spirulina sp. SIO3F2]
MSQYTWKGSGFMSIWIDCPKVLLLKTLKELQTDLVTLLEQKEQLTNPEP